MQAMEKKKAEALELHLVEAPHVRLNQFEHVPGATFCLNLYPHYRLPNGVIVHLHRSESLHELVRGRSGAARELGVVHLKRKAVCCLRLPATLVGCAACTCCYADPLPPCQCLPCRHCFLKLKPHLRPPPWTTSSSTVFPRDPLHWS